MRVEQTDEAVGTQPAAAEVKVSDLAVALHAVCAMRIRHMSMWLAMVSGTWPTGRYCHALRCGWC